MLLVLVLIFFITVLSYYIGLRPNEMEKHDSCSLLQYSWKKNLTMMVDRVVLMTINNFYDMLLDLVLIFSSRLIW